MRWTVAGGRWAFAVLPLAAACGGSSFSAAPGVDGSIEDGGDASSDVSAGPDSRDEGGKAETGSEASVGDAASDSRDGGVDDASIEACAHTVFFLDGDGDGYGGTTSSTGCGPPDTGAWVTKGNDCDDSNPMVNPGQTAYFTTGYTRSGTSNVSFDYDCDGQETESGSNAKAACAYSGLTCAGSGYLAATPARSGPGVDAYCGSDEAVTCSVVDLTCTAGPPVTTSPIACH
jgi:hypothetical protein